MVPRAEMGHAGPHEPELGVPHRVLRQETEDQEASHEKAELCGEKEELQRQDTVRPASEHITVVPRTEPDHTGSEPEQGVCEQITRP